ncbi:MAG: tRNA uridine-5-carboxymethylaminomethyl(34) synthesis GTPase MnmE [Acidobacteria bacterium]|nr:tRNA uridine-5-carboxymethylaminomethyl(34) synthesis GTPase MnmE [Acidobacteriota bacterium]HOF82585.1 tRNA uridine-5-carboxymethylaminomethyl(34) synthesis GTPase MnmE [Candidatus Aminicenantes bacterium]NMD11623.1 tRNA uridine-5-carboxymethylaminomethyl(34) synthesis GTPase MnmE [Acidobacteriota bacterium]HOS10448.1 tRNA uridine-5-carboxymethylaminomethyl(34) synthesis GTPase MnmE [Candidatus Aminicenantes bacterium]HPL13096.1 tRNA uridine-5-carboxymethylaminomethyl(34) synthesis GTPase M
MYDLSLAETIVAVSTPPGCGGIGVVRLSGPAALKIARTLFRPKKDRRGGEPGRAVLGEVVDPADRRPFDEGFLLHFRAPRSFTGEDVAELHLHGSPVILEEVVRLAVRRGARPALPGEFTLRAFLNGRIDFLQAEAVDDLVRSASLARAKSAFRTVNGALSRKAAAVRREIIGWVAQLEADIEFPEEGRPAAKKHYIDKIDKIYLEVDRLVRSYEMGQALGRGVTIALVGRVNSGKSTLFNGLLEEPRAIVTPFPGTTRDFLRETVRINDASFLLVDMAGLGRAGSPIEREGIRRGKKIAAEADGLLLLLDGSRRLSASDAALIESYRSRKIILVLNKTDLPEKTTPAEVTRRFPDLPVAAVSALRGDGLDVLRKMMYDVFFPLIPGRDIIVLRERDKLLLEEIAARLLRAKEMIASNQPIELAAEEAREIVTLTGRLTGEIRPDDILDDVFSRFCIGK